MATENKDSSFQEIKRVGKVSNDGVFVFSISEKRFVFLNPPMVKILEIDKKLLMEEAHVVLHSIPIEEMDYLELRFAELLDLGAAEHVEVRVVQNNVQKFLSCSAYLASDKKSVIGFLKDVTTAKKHEEYLVNYGARKDALLDMVAQNLSTPLNLSKFTVDLIEKAIKEKKYHRLNAHISLMREVTSESIKVIDKFLQEEHLESPRLNPKVNRFDIISKIMIIVERLKETNPDKHFKLHTESKHLFIETDEVKFFQIVHNLLSNSMKFTEPQGTIEVVVRDHKRKVEIIVKDEGVGIPEDLKPFIFEKKTRAARPGLNGEISNGIGLYVVKQLTELLGGKIYFESEENKGTRFMLELPKT